MTNSEIVKEELIKLNVFSGKLNSYALNMANSLDDDVPLSMRLNISNYSLASFVSHFHTKIVLDTDFIPTNFVGFTLAKSGASKTSSVVKLEKALSKGYEIISDFRNEKAEQKAKEVAEANDEENWEKYLKRLNPLAMSLSTEAGMIKKLNEFKEEGIGLPSLFVDEIGTEFGTSPDIVPNIKLISELFDSGNKKARALATEENERAEVKGMGMSALFIGSEANILLDEAILKKFNSEFVTKLARRCFFNFPNFDYMEKDCNDIEDILTMDLDKKEFKLANSLEIENMAHDVALNLSQNDINNIMIDVDAERLYRIYKFHCKYESEEIQEESVMLEQLHRHWKVLKLAGVYAAADCRKSISMQDLIEAISFAELISEDLGRFIELSKREHYEILIDLLKEKESLSIHELKKREILTGKTKPESQISAMIDLGNSKLGKEGMLKFEENKVFLELFKEVEHGASYKKVSGTKEERAFKCKDGYIYEKSTFPKLSALLSNDTSYCAFKYRDGIRSNDNIDSGATFVVIDIDDSDISWEEAHDILGDYNHHISKTSDDNNPYKFRILIELDIEVSLDSRLWKNFMAKIGEHLGLSIDLLPKSQQYYGFKDRKVLSNLNGEPLEASSLVKTIELVPKKIDKLPPSKVTKAYDDRFDIFSYAYEVGGDTGATAMYRAFKHAKDLGFSKEQVISLLKDICDYRDTDYEYIMKRTGMLRQIERNYNDV